VERIALQPTFSEEPGDLKGALEDRTREQHRRFGPPITLVTPIRTASAAPLLEILAGVSPLRALAIPDGRVVLTGGRLSQREGIWQTVPGAALIDFAGARRESHVLGGGLRTSPTSRPLREQRGAHAKDAREGDVAVSTATDRIAAASRRAREPPAPGRDASATR
jgi:hypothetical protein